MPLLQLPTDPPGWLPSSCRIVQFPPDAKVEWKVEDDSLDGFRGRCQVNGGAARCQPPQ